MIRVNKVVNTVIHRLGRKEMIKATEQTSCLLELSSMSLEARLWNHL